MIDHSPDTKRQINRLNYEIKKEIKIQKLKDWNKHCSSINCDTNPRKFWQKVKLSLNPSRNKSVTELIDQSGNRITNEQDQADLMASTICNPFMKPIPHPLVTVTSNSRSITLLTKIQVFLTQISITKLASIQSLLL